MKKIVALTTSLFFLFALTVDANEFRTWTSANGKYKTEARLFCISEDGKTVVLVKKEDGKDVDVALDKLSKADQAYVRKQQKEMKEAEREARKATKCSRMG